MAQNGTGKPVRERIIDAALILVARNGYDGTTVRSLCRAARTSTGGFTAHFKTKSAAVSTLLDSIIAELVERLSFASEQTLEGEDEMENHVRALAAWAFSHPEALRVWFNLASRADLMDTFDVRGRFLAQLDDRLARLYSERPGDDARGRWLALYHGYAQTFGAALMWAGAEHYHSSIGLGEADTQRMRQISIDSTLRLMRKAKGDGSETA